MGTHRDRLRRLFSFVTGSLFISSSLLSCSNEPASQPKIYDPDTTRLVSQDHDSHHYAVSLGTGGCSGTLIAKNVVLTAAHCLDLFSVVRWPQLQVSSWIVKQHKAKNYFLNKTNFQAQNDIGILILGSTPKEVDLQKLPLLPSADFPLNVDDSVSIKGFGLTRGPAKEALRLRSVSLPIIGINDDEDIKNTFRLQLSPESRVCPGDSGSGNYIKVDDQTFVVGVTSTGDHPKLKGNIDRQRCKDWVDDWSLLSVDVRQYLDFIQPYLPAK